MNINDILDVVRGLAPEDLAASWDNSGLQVAGEHENVTRLAVTIDPLPEVLEQAVQWGAQAIVTHHPLYFDPPALSRSGPFLQVARLLLGSGVWLYSAHTSLDCRPGGPAFWLGRALGLTDLRVLEPLETGAEAGFGQVGRLREPLDFASFESLLAEVVGRTVWSECGPRPERVSTVAYMPGSGSSAMAAALAAGADVYVTGDMKYHQALAAPVCVLDVGHHALEEEMTRLFAAELSEALPGVETRFFPSEDPLRFRVR